MKGNVKGTEGLSDWLAAANQRFAPELSQLLRTDAQVNVVDIQTKTYGEYLLDVALPTCLHGIATKPNPGHFIVETPPRILSQWLDRLLGADASTSGPAQCPLTEIELRLVGKVLTLLLSALRTTLPNATVESFVVERSEFGLKEMRRIRPTEDVHVACLEILADDDRSTLSICLAEALWQSWWTPAPSAGEAIEDGTVELIAQLAETTLTAEELATLAVGDILATDTDVGEPLTITLDGLPTFRANLGKVDNKKAIQIVAKATGDRPGRGSS